MEEKIPATNGNLMQATGIHKKFSDTSVLNGIDISLKEGEILAIMGPSGSGKSTLLHCLAGIVDTDKGIVRYGDVDITKLSQKDRTKLRRSDFAFIFQFGELVPELPVIDNVVLPLLLQGVGKKGAYSAGREWLDKLDISSIEHDLPHTLSGGETQRVAIARAMAMNPTIIFADEPTGSLDSVNASRVMRLFVELANQHNKSIVFVTHSKKTAGYADRVIRLRDGLIIGDSTGK